MAQRRKLGGVRGIALIVVGIFMGATLITPAVGHVGGTLSHLWGAPNHIKAKVRTFGDGRWLKKTAKAADAEQADVAPMQGWEIVSANTADDTTSPKSLITECPTGKVTVGGGYTIIEQTADGSVVVTLDRAALGVPYPGHGWFVIAQNTASENWQMFVQAICADVPA